MSSPTSAAPSSTATSRARSRRRSGASTTTCASRSGSDRADACSTSGAGGGRCCTRCGARRRRSRRHALQRAGGRLPASRSRRAPRGRARGVTRDVRRRSTPSPASARSSTSAHRRSTGPGSRSEIYGDLFAAVARMLPDRGRFYLQTMVFGRNMIPYEEVDIDAPRDSDAWYLALMGRQFPGSWLPSGQAQIVACAAPHFRLMSSIDGRLDYIETIRRWRERFASAQPEEDVAEGAARASVAHECRLPARVHVGGEREHRLLRAPPARPPPPRVREAVTSRPSAVPTRSRRSRFMRCSLAPGRHWP